MAVIQPEMLRNHVILKMDSDDEEITVELRMSRDRVARFASKQAAQLANKSLSVIETEGCLIMEIQERLGDS